MSLDEELRAIREEYGKLTTKLVVDVARESVGSELHQRLYLDLDDDKAADVGRRYIAGALIRQFRVTYKDPARPKSPERSVRAWHSLPSIGEEDDESGGYEYVPVEEVVRDPMTLQIVLREMEREWKAFKARYAHLKEFAEIILRDLGDEAA